MATLSIDPVSHISSDNDVVTSEIFIAAPPERDLEWTESGVEGASRFLNRLWRFVHAHREEIGAAGPPGPGPLSEAGRAFRRVIHETVARVTSDVERDFHFNTAISAVMELVNALHDFERDSPRTRAKCPECRVPSLR